MVRCLIGTRGLVALLLVLSTGPTWAQRYTVQEAGLDGGGGTVTAGTLALTSSVGGASPVGTVAAGPYVLYSGLPSPFSGRIAILILHDPAAAGVAERNQAQPLTARILTNEAPLASATLVYRAGRDAEPTTVPLTADGEGLVGTIPAAAVNDGGLTYFFVATDAQGTTIRAPRSGVYSLPVRLPQEGAQKTTPLPGGATQSAYRLLSMPIVLDDPSPEAVLGDDVPSLAQAATYDAAVARLFEPIGTRVAEFPGTGDFELGRAFWLIVRDGIDEIDSGSGTTSVLNEPVRIALDRGWNFVGTPFTVPVPVANLRTTSSTPVILRSYGADGYNTPETPVTAMAPFEGYALFVEAATTLVVDPPVPDAEQRRVEENEARVETSPYQWRLRLRGIGRGGRDVDNIAGVHPQANEGWDEHDWLDPPSIADGLSIAFDAPDGGPADLMLSADTRPASRDGTTWPFTVRTDVAGPVRLSVEGLSEVPARFEAWLLDASTNETWDLRVTAQARIDVLADHGGVRPMRLLVGTKEYVAGALQDVGARPSIHELHPPYPNPSRERVAFQVGLATDDRVTIEVHNVLGQRVAVLKDRAPMPAGLHTVVWNPGTLASGLYIVRMKAGSYRATQKLMRVQ